MKYLDLETWERSKHYRLFKDYLNPFFSICANVNITRLMEYIQKNHLPFFAAFLHLVMKVINDIPEFRTRIREDGVVLHEVVHPSYTVMTDENLFRFVTTPFDADRFAFIDRVCKDIESCKKTIVLEDEDRDDLIYISSVKWVSFTGVTHPYDNKKIDSFPRITWGKYFTDQNQTWIPFSIAAHHSLCDGAHAGLIYNRLLNEIDHILD